MRNACRACGCGGAGARRVVDAEAAAGAARLDTHERRALRRVEVADGRDGCGDGRGRGDRARVCPRGGKAAGGVGAVVRRQGDALRLAVRQPCHRDVAARLVPRVRVLGPLRAPAFARRQPPRQRDLQAVQRRRGAAHGRGERQRQMDVLEGLRPFGPGMGEEPRAWLPRAGPPPARERTRRAARPRRRNRLRGDAPAPGPLRRLRRGTRRRKVPAAAQAGRGPEAPARGAAADGLRRAPVHLPLLRLQRAPRRRPVPQPLHPRRRPLAPLPGRSRRRADDGGGVPRAVPPLPLAVGLDRQLLGAARDAGRHEGGRHDGVQSPFRDHPRRP